MQQVILEKQESIRDIKTRDIRVWHSSGVEHLPSMQKTLGLISSTMHTHTQEKKRKK
jgi:hypothetical protein